MTSNKHHKKTRLNNKKKSLKNKIDYLEFDKNIGNYYLQDLKEKYNNYDKSQEDIKKKQIVMLKELVKYLSVVRKKTNLNKDELQHLLMQKKDVENKIKYLKNI